jgi:hypothetical protein
LWICLNFKTNEREKEERIVALTMDFYVKHPFADLVVTSLSPQNDKLYFSKFALVAASPVFQSLLASNWETIHLNYSSRTLNELFNLIVGRKLSTLDSPTDLLDAVEEFQLGGLMSKIDELLVSMVPEYCNGLDLTVSRSSTLQCYQT